jgi:anti-anti-sigma factor
MPDKPVLVPTIASRAESLPPAFECSWAEGGLEAAWVRLAGELDVATTPQLERALREPQLQARLLVLDLRELAFTDSSGVQVIVDASIRAREAGHRLLLLRGPPGVDRVFTLTGSPDDLVSGDIHTIEPSFQALMVLVEEEASR